VLVGCSGTYMHLLHGPMDGEYLSVDSAATLPGSYRGKIVGDLNNDGFSDIVTDGDGVGYAYLFHGPVSGDLLASDADWRSLDLSFHGSEAGNDAISVGDLNGDDRPELIFSSSPDTVIDILSGFDGDSPALLGRISTSAPGVRSAYAGDVNNDGYGDLLIGNQFVGRYDEFSGSIPDTGEVYLILGPLDGFGNGHEMASTVFVGDAMDSRFGADVENAGDVNGDGHSDILIGLHGRGGGPRLFYGPVDEGTVGIESSHTEFMTVSPTNIGYVENAGDTNNDGYDDVLILKTSGDSIYLFAGEPN
jgi:hypothetical protein